MQRPVRPAAASGLFAQAEMRPHRRTWTCLSRSWHTSLGAQSACRPSVRAERLQLRSSLHDSAVALIQRCSLSKAGVHAELNEYCTATLSGTTPCDRVCRLQEPGPMDFSLSDQQLCGMRMAGLLQSLHRCLRSHPCSHCRRLPRPALPCRIRSRSAVQATFILAA